MSAPQDYWQLMKRPTLSGASLAHLANLRQLSTATHVVKLRPQPSRNALQWRSSNLPDISPTLLYRLCKKGDGAFETKIGSRVFIAPNTAAARLKRH
ncbi:hypothetical protein HDF16_004763 [Granulicella aggregans]|uniref:Uncharacterized protein n=1 Tax=Granulicella aggregans TaxID=474949 RepID=A0A7W7ZHN3_9BACT|nr:hypothetical protein [Granulicella aggregans]